MSYASEAADTLKTDALVGYAPLKGAVAGVAAAVTQLRAVSDITLVIAAADGVALACEALTAAAKAAHAEADAALLRAMNETGCTAVSHDGVTVALRNGVPSVEIADESAVPPEYMSTPAPKPDKRKIAAALKADPAAINWATLRPGPMGLTRKATT